MYVCISCLAWDRQLFPIDKYMSVLSDMTQSMKVFLLNGKVCWECKAFLKKICFFKERMLKSIKLCQQYGDLNKLKQQHIVQPILSRTKLLTLDCPPVSNVQTTVVQPIDRFLTNNLPNIQTTGIQPIDTVSTKNVPSVKTTVVQPINTVLTENVPSVQTTVVQPINTVLTNNLYYISQNESQSIINGINNLSPPMLVPIKKLIPVNIINPNVNNQTINDNNQNLNTIKTEELDIDIVKEEPIDSVATNEDEYLEQSPVVVSGESDCMIDCIIENPPKKEKIDKYQKMIEEPEMTEEPGLWSSELVTDSEMQKWRKEDESDVKYMKSLYKCVQCILGFKDAKNWRKHHEIYHNKNIGQYVCDVCQIRFTEEYILNNHRENHKRLYKCLNCGLTNRRRMVIVDHCKTVHKNVKINNSCDCNDNFRSNCERCRNNRGRRDPPLLYYNYAYKCGLCSEKVITRNELKKHLVDHHPALTQDSQNELTPYGCGDCEKKFRFPGELLSHRYLSHRRQVPARAAFTSNS